MKKISLALALLAITSMSQSALAQGKFSTGVGLYEFGGHTGVKYRYSIDDTHKLSASAGLVYPSHLKMQFQLELKAI